jgi:hypothetical protein
MAKYECPRCYSLRIYSKRSKLEDESIIVEIHYECGTILEFDPEQGKPEWKMKCKREKRH